MHALSRDERFQYDRRSEELLGETLAAFAGFDSSRLDPSEWKFLARRDQLSVHRAVSAVREGVDSHKRRVIASGFLTAGLNDVLGGLYVEEDRDLLTTQAILNPSGHTAVDAALLMIAERRQVRAAPFRFAGVKWYSWKKTVNIGNNLPLGEGQECDILTYERMGVALTEESDKEGSQEVAYRVILSLNKPEWPLNVARGPGLRRADMAFCFLYRKVCEDLVECFALVDYDCRTSASSRRAADTEMADRVLMITRLPVCARAKKLSGFVRKAKGRPVLMSKTCVRCGSRKKVMDPLRTCCICKKSVCSKCFESKIIFSINPRTHEPETDVFCHKCSARIDILTAKKNAQHNTSASANSGGSSTGGSSREKERESYSGSSESSGRSSFKFWKKTRDKREPNIRSERERRRHSLPATMIRRAEEHTPNYEGLFQNYDVFGRASDIPQRRHLYEEKFDLDEEQEPEEEQAHVNPWHEKRWRQTTFLANPEAAAAEAAANRVSLPRLSGGAPPAVREREYTVAEVYPVAKTILETENACSDDSDDSPHSEAERAHHLYLERRQRLEELKDQSFCRREMPTTSLPVHETTVTSKAASVVKSNRSITDSRGVHSRSAPALSAEINSVTKTVRRSASTRDATKARQHESDDTFRMDLYGRF